MWSDIRIKVSNADGGGLLELSAPANRFTEAQWQQSSDNLVNKTREQLAILNLTRE